VSSSKDPRSKLRGIETGYPGAGLAEAGHNQAEASFGELDLKRLNDTLPEGERRPRRRSSAGVPRRTFGGRGAVFRFSTRRRAAGRIRSA
jgi:hypothetical protein